MDSRLTKLTELVDRLAFIQKEITYALNINQSSLNPNDSIDSNHTNVYDFRQRDGSKIPPARAPR